MLVATHNIVQPDALVSDVKNSIAVLPKPSLPIFIPDALARNTTLLQVEKPKVSVIFVARNEDEWLEKTLDSLYSTANKTSYESIVYDDSSTDNCCDGLVVHQLLGSDGTSIGPSRARNMGAINAKGEILIFCDAHLKFKDNWIDELIAPIEDYRCDIVNPIISDIAITSTTGYGWDFDTKSFQYKWARYCTEFTYVGGMAGGCFAIPKDIFNKVGMFDPKFSKWGMEDSELGLRASLCGYRIAIEPKVDVGHFFKESNNYGVDWFSYNYNFLRMAYVNMDKDGLDYVFTLIPGNDVQKRDLMEKVIATSKNRRLFCESTRKISFADYKENFGRVMS